MNPFIEMCAENARRTWAKRPPVKPPVVAVKPGKPIVRMDSADDVISRFCDGCSGFGCDVCDGKGWKK